MTVRNDRRIHLSKSPFDKTHWICTIATEQHNRNPISKVESKFKQKSFNSSCRLRLSASLFCHHTTLDCNKFELFDLLFFLVFFTTKIQILESKMYIWFYIRLLLRKTFSAFSFALPTITARALHITFYFSSRKKNNTQYVYVCTPIFGRHIRAKCIKRNDGKNRIYNKKNIHTHKQTQK